MLEKELKPQRHHHQISGLEIFQGTGHILIAGKYLG
jgi:hypothetical protein